MPIDMPIDLATVNWLYVAVLTGLVLIATVVGNLLSFKHRGIGAVLTAVIFAGLFVYWTYYPHGLPLPTTVTVTAQKPAAAGGPRILVGPTAPNAAVSPRNPVTDSTHSESPAR